MTLAMICKDLHRASMGCDCVVLANFRRVSRGRPPQVTNLLHCASDIGELILFLPRVQLDCDLV